MYVKGEKKLNKETYFDQLNSGIQPNHHWPGSKFIVKTFVVSVLFLISFKWFQFQLKGILDGTTWQEHEIAAFIKWN